MSHRRGGLSDGAVLALIAGVVTAVGVLWLWGGLAGAVFGRGWPAGGVTALLEVLVRLPSHLGDPRRAWPQEVWPSLPDAAAMYVTLAALAAVLIPACLAAIRRAAALGSSLRPDWRSGTRWASQADTRMLACRRGHQLGRLGLGFNGRRLLRAERRHALVAFGPPQSGKSAGLAIPALLEWEGPVVASSIKTDLLAATVARRRALGEVLIFDPFALSGMPSHSWSPLRAARTWDGAVETAWRLAAAAELDTRGVEGGDFWAAAAEQRLAPLLYAAARGGGGVEQLVAWAYGSSQQTLERTLDRLTTEAHHREDLDDARLAYDAIRAFEAQADRTRSSIEATVQTLLRAYRFRRVVRSAAGTEISPDRLLQGHSTLYLIGDAKASKLLRPLFLALLGEVIDRAYELANQHGGRLPVPLLVCLDEAGNVAPLPNLAEIASTAPSHNIQLISIFHDLSQARGRYGGQVETVVNSHRARMLLPGVADLETLRYFSGLIGDHERRETTRTTGADGQSRSVGTKQIPLAAAESLRQLPDGTGVLLYGRLPPVRVRLRRWFDDKRLRRLAAAGKEHG